MGRRRPPPAVMPATPTSQPLMTWPTPSLKAKGLPFLLAGGGLVGQGGGGEGRGSALLAVGHCGGDGEATLAAGGHACDADVPALDDLADAELEGEGLALLVGWGGVSRAWGWGGNIG